MKPLQKNRVQKTAFFFIHGGILLSFLLFLYALFYLYTSLYGDQQGIETLYTVVYKGIAMIEQGLLGVAASLTVGFLLLSLGRWEK